MKTMGKINENKRNLSIKPSFHFRDIFGGIIADADRQRCCESRELAETTNASWESKRFVA